MKNRGWLCLFALLALLCAAALLLLPRGGDTVEIWQNGELRYALRPSALRQPQEITLSYPAGETHIHVGADGVYVLSADCRNQNCVRQGRLGAALPIVCLPERIVIRWASGAAGLDAVSG